MFLYLGSNTNVLLEKIISMHDYVNFKDVENYAIIQKAKKEKRLFLLSDIEKIKSVIITEEGVFLSSISIDTLKKRTVKVNFNFDDELIGQGKGEDNG